MAGIATIFKQKITNSINKQLELFINNSESINPITSTFIRDHRLDTTDRLVACM